MPKIFHLVINPKSLEFYEDIKEYATGLKYFQYLKVVEHIGQEEKHYHMFLQLSRDLPKLSINKLHGAHIKPKMFGSTQKIIDYIDCKDEEHQKNGVTAVLIDEIGEYKKQGGISVKALLEMENIDDIPDYRMFNTWSKLNSRRPMKARQRRKQVKVYYIQGPSGAGKTNMAIDLAEEYENKWDTFTDWLKCDNGFYSGITGNAKIAIYDDFRPSDMKAKEFVNLIDYNKHNLNIKNSGLTNNYNLIIITSVIKLSTIYKNVELEEPRKQWERRIELIDMYDKNDNLSLITNQSREYERDDECYYCDHKILCNCKCIENKRTCIEEQCNCNVMKCDFFNKD